MDPTFHYSRSFKESAEQLHATQPSAWAGVMAALQYLREFRRAAVAPDVRWGIAESAFRDDCGEVRWPNPEVQSDSPEVAVRGLFVAHPLDEWFVFTVLGNKAVGRHRGNAWYIHAVRESDEIVRRAVVALNLTTLSSE